MEQNRALSVKTMEDGGALYEVDQTALTVSFANNEDLQEKVKQEYREFFREKTKRETLDKCVLFQKLSNYDKARIASGLQEVDCADGEVVIEQGAPGANSMFFVKSGSFECYNAQGAVLKVCREMDFFGELGLILNQDR